jgi:hypothetical protein
MVLEGTDSFRNDEIEAKWRVWQLELYDDTDTYGDNAGVENGVCQMRRTTGGEQGGSLLLGPIFHEKESGLASAARKRIPAFSN